MLPSPESSQLSVTESWDTSADSPVGLAGRPGAGSGVGGVGAHPGGCLAGAVGVDGLDAVHVASLGVDAVSSLSSAVPVSGAVRKVPWGWMSLSRRRPVMLPSPGSSQERVTKSWDTSVESPVGRPGAEPSKVCAGSAAVAARARVATAANRKRSDR